MKVLGIESSAVTASVAVADENTLIAEYTVNYKMTHSQTLLPMIDKMFSQVGIKPDDIDVYAVSQGPGSFTGLRIGAATGKGLALAFDKKMVAVPTLEAMAYNLYGYTGYICPVMDARRKHLYSGIYTFEAGKLKTVKDACLISYEELANEAAALTGSAGQAVFVGDGCDTAGEYLAECLGDKCIIAPPHLKTQRAGSVAWYGMIMAQEGRYADADTFKPEYLRPSQAERERSGRDD